MKKAIFFVLIVVAIFIPVYSFAEECRETSSSMGAGELESIQKACQDKINANRQDQSTLKQAISSINAKVNLAQAQINQTVSQINSLEKDITILSGVLDTVNQSMGDLGKIYLARVKESYRRSRITPIDMVFSSDSFGDFLTKLKYINIIKMKDQLILTELENSRMDYDQRKQAKVDKQLEVEKLKAKLESQKKLLSQQQKEKQSVLSLTQNDEKKYQSLLAQANSLVAAMRGFTSGATPLNNQTHCDGWGCYYSQRDSLWFSQRMGDSNETIGRVGCLVTSTAMIVSHLGKTLKPSDIAASSNPFFPFTAYMNAGSWTVNGITVNRQQGLSKDTVDNELGAGRPVIAGLNTANGTHFIVLKGKNDQGYIMNDPYMENGYDKQFTSTYSTGQIFRFDKVTIN